MESVNKKVMKAVLITDKQEALGLTNGTHLVGKLIGITYKDLVNAFGEPTFIPEDSGDGKVNFEWVFKFGDEVFTVYDWKVSEEYAKYIMGRMDEIQFHIGGKTEPSDFIEFIQDEILDPYSFDENGDYRN